MNFYSNALTLDFIANYASMLAHGLLETIPLYPISACFEFHR